MHAVLVLAAILALSGPALADSPSDAVRFFYTPPQFEPDAAFRNRFTDPAKTVFDKNDKVSQTDEIGCIDFVLAADAQDFDEAEITKTLDLKEAISGDTATVTATFFQFPPSETDGEAPPKAEIIWSLKQQGGAWLISDIKSRINDWKLSNFDCEASN